MARGKRGKGVVLLVEDDPHDAMLVERSFDRGGLGVSLVKVRDGREALDYLEDRVREGDPTAVPRFILLDLKLPRMDGFEFLREVKTNPAFFSIPVVVLTSSLELEDVERAYQLGANAYLVKPLRFEDFMEMMQVVGTFWVSFNVTCSTNIVY